MSSLVTIHQTSTYTGMFYQIILFTYSCRVSLIWFILFPKSVNRLMAQRNHLRRFSQIFLSMISQLPVQVQSNFIQYVYYIFCEQIINIINFIFLSSFNCEFVFLFSSLASNRYMIMIGLRVFLQLNRKYYLLYNRNEFSVCLCSYLPYYLSWVMSSLFVCALIYHLIYHANL